nr:hypothetical protein [Tanacetum cinerariifolium]
MPPQYPIVYPPLHEMSLHELSMMMNLGTPTLKHLVNSFVYKKSDNDIKVTPAYTLPLPFLATMEPADTFLKRDEVISTIPAREIDEFIKSSVDDLVSIPRESEVTSDINLECSIPLDSPPSPRHDVLGERKSSVDDLVSIPRESEVTSDINLECSIPLDSPPSPRHDVLGERKVDIDLPFGENLETLSTGDREIDFNPRDIETNDLIPGLRIFDVPLVKGTTRVMETPSFSSHQMPSPRPAAYSPTEVMYCYYYPHLTSGDGFDHGLKMK